MKITIELTKAEVDGIKDYLKEVDGLEKVTKKDIEQFMSQFTDIINAPQESVSWFILKHKNHDI